MKKEEMIDKIKELLDGMDEDEVAMMYSTIEDFKEVTRYNKRHAPKVK
jgi:hypothetical protein